MRMRRRSDFGDRAPLVKGMPGGDREDDGDASRARGRSWYARLRQCWRRAPAIARHQTTDTASIETQQQQQERRDADDTTRDRGGVLGDGLDSQHDLQGARDHSHIDTVHADAKRDTDADSWHRAYANVYGIDSESGDPMDHAVLRRIGASWRFMWACRQPIAEAPTTPGAAVRGEWALPNGDLVRGAFCVCHLPSSLEKDAPIPTGPALSCARVVCPIAIDVGLAKGHSLRDYTEENDSGSGDGQNTQHWAGGNGDHDNHHHNGGDDDKGQDATPCRARIPSWSSAQDDALRTIDAQTNGAKKRRNTDAETMLALVPHGYAAAIGIDGSLIEGAFCMGLLNGHGRTVDARGEIFGQWRHGRLHGRAVAVTQDGWFVCATWRDGRLMGDYFAHAVHGEQFRCKTCPDGRFDGPCRRGYPGGDWAIERWSDGVLVGIDGFRIAPVADSEDLVDGAVLDDCTWSCDRVRGGDAGVRYDGHIYYPSDPTTRAFALFYAYMASEASTRAFTDPQRDAFVWAMWMARRRHAAGMPI
nr:hypothetical protein [Pandoravirus massiliensis]